MKFFIWRKKMWVDLKIFKRFFVFHETTNFKIYDVILKLLHIRKYVVDFNRRWFTILIARVHACKRTKVLKPIIIARWLIATGWKLKKFLEQGLSLQNQTEELETVVSYTNISPSFILILNRIQEKQWK